MTTDRRQFIQQATLAGMAMGIPAISSAASTAAVKPADQSMNVLVLGGTGFIGPPMVEYLLARGHKVTIFNRGQSNTDLFPGVEKLVGDRNDDLSALEGRSWDVVFDNHASRPGWVQKTTDLLKDSVGRYVYVSSISVYADPGYSLPENAAEAEPMRLDEDAALAVMPENWDGSEEITGETYGPFKWMCEDAAEAAFPGKATVVRPGLIVGPGDPTDRFTYWPVRIARGGDVLAPGSGNDAVQVIDVRDLTQFIVRLAENDVSGVFNATGPQSRMTMAGMLHGIRAATSSDIQFTWVPAEFLAEHEVNPWAQMPAWLPGSPILNVRLDRAIAQGLVYRPLADTVQDTLEWHASRPAEAQENLRAGLSPEREAEVLAAWRASA